MPGRSRPMAESANQRLISILRSRSCVSVSTLDDLPEEPVPVAYRAERLEIGVEADERTQEEDAVPGSAEDAMRERDLRHLRAPRQEVVIPRVGANVALERLARDVHDLHHRRGIVVRVDEAERRAGGGDPGVVASEEGLGQAEVAAADLRLEQPHAAEVEEAETGMVGDDVVSGVRVGVQRPELEDLTPEEPEELLGHPVLEGLV